MRTRHIGRGGIEKTNKRRKVTKSSRQSLGEEVRSKGEVVITSRRKKSGGDENHIVPKRSHPGRNAT